MSAQAHIGGLNSADNPPSAWQQEHRAETALSVLVIEDDPPVREACAEIANSLGLVTATADSVPAARAALGQVIDIVLLDLKLPGGDGLSLLEEIRSRHPSAAVVVMTAFASVDTAVECLRVGAADYLPKPFTLEELSETLQRAALRRTFDVESRRLRERLRSGRGEGTLTGRSPGMEKLYRILSKVAFTTHPVLILGEPGTGKGTVARAIHMNGPRSAEPFMTVDCSAQSPDAIARELFGDLNEAAEERSAHGLLVAAGAGTIFIEEVGELSLELQARLLRALQDRAVRPDGGADPVPFSARILASSSRDLQAMVTSGRFRKDLFFRLNIVNLRVPPLRERKADLPTLAGEILNRMREERGQPYTFATDTIRLMMDYDWPGNVRELEQAIQRACALSSGPVLHLGDLPTQLQDAHMHQRQSAPEPESFPAPTLEPDSPGAVLPIAQLEKQAILKTLRQMNGDKLMTAKLLGIGKTTLYRKLKEYELSDDEI